ncbi:MAG: Ig-like domain-containing protein [Desulfamplus sp.]|nr:Ig-like domain-containing protein [Desulfamplus sp.]
MKKSLMVIVYWITLFAVTLSGSDVYSATNYDIEPHNDKRIYAKEVTFGDKIVGNLWHALDYDWYAVNVPYAGIVSLTAYYEFPSGSKDDTDVLFVEVRSVENDVITDFFIDYMDYKTNTPYIRDINIPSSGNYYIVVHCPSQAKFKRDRYYLTMARGAGENSNVFILNEEDSVSVQVHDQGGAVDDKSKETLTASVTDEYGNPVAGAMVVFSRAFGDSINPKNNELVFSGKDIDSEGITDNFFLFGGEKDIVFTYNSWDFLADLESGYIKVQLVNTETGEKTYLYSTTEDITEHVVTKNILSDANYYLDITTQNEGDIWEVRIPNKSFSTTSDEIGTAVTGTDGKANYTYISTDQKGDFTITAAFANSSDKLVVKHTAGSPSKLNILALDNDILYINREYNINIVVTDKNGNLIEDATPLKKGTKVVLRAFDSETDLINIDPKDIDKYIDKTLKIKEPLTPDYKNLEGDGKLSLETKSGMAKFNIFTSNVKKYKLTATIEDTDITDPKPEDQPFLLTFHVINLTNMIAQPAYILADGKSTSTISVRLSDSKGLAVSGEPVAFTTDCGNLLTNSAKTDDKGIAQVTLLAPYAPGTCTVTASYGTAKLTAPVEFYGDGTGSTTASIDLEVSPKTISTNGKSSAVITATLKDNAGNNVAIGTPVQFETTKGIFPNGSNIFKGSTTIEGVIKVSLISKAEDTPGNAIITCSSAGITQLTQIAFVRADADGSPIVTAYINLTANPTSIPISSPPKYNSLMITAALFDSAGKAVPAGTPITFYADKDKAQFAGGLDSFTAATTDESGTVSVALRSLTKAGSVDVWCLSNDVYQLTTVTFIGTDVTPTIGSITLTTTPAPPIIPVNSSLSIRAEIKDTLGNPVPQGTSVEFKTDKGTFQKTTVKTLDSSGVIIVPLMSDSTPGYAHVTVSSGGVSQSILVTFTGLNPAVGTITLTADKTSIPADGLSTALITAEIKDVDGKAVPSGTAVAFSTTFGTFLASSSATTDMSGKVTAVLVSSTTPGSAVVSVSSGGIFSTIKITFGNTNTERIIILTAEPPTIPADGSSSTFITAAITDASKIPVASGTSIKFTTTLGKFSNGQKEITLTTSDYSGIVTIPLIAGNEKGTAIVTAIVSSGSGSVSQSISVTFTDPVENSGKVAYLSLLSSQSAVKSDNSDKSTITATVLDSNRAPLKNATVTFSITAGQISNYTAVTDADGKAVVFFSSGLEKENQTVMIKASSPNETLAKPDAKKEVPIKISGTYLTLDPGQYTNLEIDSTDPSKSTVTTLTITALDAGGTPIPDAEITVSKSDIDPTELGVVKINNLLIPQTLVTNYYGKIEIPVQGISSGKVTIKAEGLGDTKTQAYSVVDPGKSLRIIEPAEDSVQLFIYKTPHTLYDPDKTGDYNILKITANIPTSTKKITFISSIGDFSINENGPWSKLKLDIDKVLNTQNVYFKSDTAGIASIYVVDFNDYSQSDSMTAIIAASPTAATQISLQASPIVVAPSSGDVINVSNLTATVKNISDQPVANVMVTFSIDTPLGGGEKISPAWAITDSSGIARSKFTSGSLSSGGKGIKISAKVKDLEAATTEIIIGGTAGSIVIGRSILAQSDDTSTYYILPMSVLVSDAAGHPVANQDVSIKSWPMNYYTGWRDGEGNAVYSGVFPNEDSNRNNILDSTESDGNKDGLITPPNSSSGNVVLKNNNSRTDANGVLNFDLVYLKNYASWIDAEIEASIIVLGTETISQLVFTLPYIETDKKYLPHSPFNTSLILNASPNRLVADGVSFVAISAILNDAKNEGKDISFTTTKGTFVAGTGVTVVDGVAKTTTVNGIAKVTLKSPTTTGIATVTATSGDMTSNVLITFIPGKVATIDLVANPTTLTVDGTSTTTITATVKDANGNMVADGETINFATANIGGRLSSSTAPTVNGVAEVTYTAPDILTSTPDTITASYGSITKTTPITLIAQKVGSITLEADPTSIVADGFSSSAITATVLDTLGNPMPAWTTKITFTTTKGTFYESGSSTLANVELRDNTGEVTVSLISSKVNTDVAEVRAEAGGKTSQTVYVKFNKVP